MGQLVTAILSGAIVQYEPEYIDSEEELKEYRELNLTCFSQMLAHMTGFAAINMFGTMQIKVAFMSASPLHTLLVLPIGFFSLLIIFRGTDTIRNIVSGWDGEVDEAEELWDEEAEEA